MRAHEFIAETTLTDLIKKIDKSHIKDVIGWDKNRFADIFLSGDYQTDRKGYRIYLPLQKSTVPVVNIPDEIKNALSEKGYEITDYIQGYAKKIGYTGKNHTKIGKLLPPDLVQDFAKDKQREAHTKVQDDYMIVISRHPVDIATMSTNRSWDASSCLNLRDGGNKHYIPLEIKEGTIVAYLVEKTDPKIKNAVARIAIKPFIEENTKKIFFGAENRVYGPNVPGFARTVISWVNQVNKKRTTVDSIMAYKSPKVYDDSRGTDTRLSLDRNHPSYIRFIENPSIEQQMAAIKKDSWMIKHIDNPSPEVQLAAVQDNPWVIQSIRNPTLEVQLYVVSQEGKLIRFIGKNASEEVQIAAVKQNPNVLDYIIVMLKINPSPEVYKAAGRDPEY